jgi:hypothetical protein
MEAVILAYLLLGNLAALFLHLAASEFSYAGNERISLLSTLGIFLAGASFLAVALIGITTLGALVIGAAILNAVWYLILSREAPAGQS